MRFSWPLIFLVACSTSASTHAPDLAALAPSDAGAAIDGAIDASEAACVSSTGPTTLYLDTCPQSPYCFHDYDPQGFF